VNIEELPDTDFRKTLPRFNGNNLEDNQTVAGEFASIAKEKGCTPAQLALAWVLSQGEDMIPIPGTKKRKYLEENAGAVNVQLSAADLATIDAFVHRLPVKGERYTEGTLKLIEQ
jgi:aryl-alcohol dehydrogenase-like predicted oxidoreductase